MTDPDTVARIMKIRDGMTPDPLAEAIIEREIAALQPHSSPDSDWPPQFELMKLEVQSPKGEWIPIFPAQLQWMAKDGHPVRAIEAPGEAATPQEFTPRDAWDELVHKDDRTSPEEYPDHCLISFEELQDFMSRERGPEPEPTKEDFAKWARVWHDTCETIMTLLDLPGGGSPQEMLAQVQARGVAQPKLEPLGFMTVDEWPKEIDERVLIYVVHQNAQYEADQAKREAEWEGWHVGYWTDFNGGGWVWHGMLGTITHVAPLLPPPSSISSTEENTP
jgi:hypothetical protein